MKTSKNYDELLIESLKNPKEALAYLNAALKEYSEEDEESQQLLLLAIKDVVIAQGGISLLAKKTGLGRESLYKTLSAKGNPRLSTLATLVHGMGFDLTISLPSKK